MGNCHNTIEVNASVNEVWDKIINFHDLSWAPNVIEKVETVGDKSGNEIGAKRVLNDAFHETLLSVDASNHTFTYAIENGPGPLESNAVDSYVGKVVLKPSGNGTEVVWTYEYQSQDDNGIAELCNPVYQALLSDLAKQF